MGPDRGLPIVGYHHPKSGEPICSDCFHKYLEEHNIGDEDSYYCQSIIHPPDIEVTGNICSLCSAILSKEHDPDFLRLQRDYLSHVFDGVTEHAFWTLDHIFELLKTDAKFETLKVCMEALAGDFSKGLQMRTRFLNQALGDAEWMKEELQPAKQRKAAKKPSAAEIPESEQPF